MNPGELENREWSQIVGQYCDPFYVPTIHDKNTTKYPHFLVYKSRPLLLDLQYHKISVVIIFRDQVC